MSGQSREQIAMLQVITTGVEIRGCLLAKLWRATGSTPRIEIARELGPRAHNAVLNYGVGWIVRVRWNPR
jgi:hypothetical protein